MKTTPKTAETKAPGRKTARAAEAKAAKRKNGVTRPAPRAVSAPVPRPAPAAAAQPPSLTPPLPRGLTQEELLQQAVTGHYDSGVNYGDIVYAVGDAPLPAPEKAKVKMGLNEMKDPDMMTYIENHIEMMTGNALYPTPSPPAADFLAQFTTYRNALAAMDAAKTIYDNALAILKAQRKLMIVMMNRRAGYVLDASNGNSQAIISSGLGVQSARTPTTFLPAPMNLRIELNGEAGLVKVRWDAVSEARNYVLQYRLENEVSEWQQMTNTTRTSLLTNLVVGKTYSFRVAACGVPGQSNWSPPVSRGVA